MEFVPLRFLSKLSAGVPTPARSASVFFTTLYLPPAACTARRSLVSASTVMPWKVERMTVDTLASSVLSLSRSCCFSLRFFIVLLRWLGLLNYAAAIASASARSMVMPGPMVEVSVIFLTYLPLAAAGLAFTTASITAWAFSASFALSNWILPMGQWTMPALSTRNSTLPALTSLMALATSKVTVPVFGLGISPRGPSTLPSLPAERIMSGVAITAS